MVNREVLVSKIASGETVFKAAIDDTPDAAFTRYRSIDSSDSVDRGVVIEESMDQVAASDIEAGTYVVKGSISGAFRTDPTSLKLLVGSMGVQDGSTPAGTYYLEQTPQELALFIIDEQANASAGTGTYYEGVGISGMEFNIEVKKFATVKWSWIGMRGITTDSPTNDAIPPTYSSFPMYVFYNAVLSFDDATLKLKGLTMSIERKMDEDYYYIGSQFLQGLFYNGLTTLGGTFNLGAGEWDLLERTINGTTSAGGLDGAHTQFAAENKNAIASGALVVTLTPPGGSADEGKPVVVITAASCKVTSMSRDVTGRAMWNKTAQWQGQISASSDFSVVVGEISG